MTKRRSKNGDYDIGHGKTPEYTRFRPGQSGNPKGRPKKEKLAAPPSSQSEFDETLRAELDRVLTVNEGGKPKRKKARDLVPRAQIKLALQGNSHAQQQVMKAARDLELRDAERAAAAVEAEKAKREEDILIYNYMVRQKAERAQIWIKAEAQGKEPDQPWPHPDDILLWPDRKKYDIRGPYRASQLPNFNWYRAERDYVYALYMSELGKAKRNNMGLSNVYMCLWVQYDIMLPLRWQLFDKPRGNVAFFNLSRLTKRQLEKEIEYRRRNADFAKAAAGIGNRYEKEAYKVANAIMKPLLQPRGFRSLAEFERAYEEQGPSFEWPKRP